MRNIKVKDRCSTRQACQAQARHRGLQWRGQHPKSVLWLVHRRGAGAPQFLKSGPVPFPSSFVV